MSTRSPGPARVAIMVAFALSCVGLLLFLWLSFGGPTPLKPKGYRFQAAFPEATTLSQEADVRLAGVTIGKVKRKELDKRAGRTLVTMEIERRFAPVPRDVRAILRQKTLLGETYIELTPGHPSAGMLPEGARLSDGHVANTVQIDEIFSTFDEPTRAAFREWMAGVARALEGRGQDVNDILGNFPSFADDGTRLFSVLDDQGETLRHLVRNTSVVAGALNERQGALRQLVVNSDHMFQATASRDQALSETISVFPTFLTESRLTLRRLQRFAANTKPLVDRLKAPADDLAPTLRDLSALSPSLQRLFIDLNALIRAGRRGLPATRAVLAGLEPALEALTPFLAELNPILAFMAFNQETVAGFLSNGSANLANETNGSHQQTQVGIIDQRSFQQYQRRPSWERGNAYVAPNAYHRVPPLGAVEAFDCNAAGGVVRDPVESPVMAPPCFVAPPSLYNGRQFPFPARDVLGRSRAPHGYEGNRPPTP